MCRCLFIIFVKKQHLNSIFAYKKLEYNTKSDTIIVYGFNNLIDKPN